MIDTTSVHVYAGVKIVSLAPERDADAIEARRLIDDLVQAGRERRSSDAGTDVSVRESAAQTLALGSVLLKLRALGREEVAKGRESDLRAFIKPGSDDPLAKASPEVQASADHGLLVFILALMRLGDKTPLVSDEALLYEAYLSELVPLGDDGLEGVIRASQAWVTAKSELCDVAGRFSERLSELPLDFSKDAADKLAAGLVVGAAVSNNPHTHDSGEDVIAHTLARAVPWMIRLLANVRTAQCYEQREQMSEAVVQWQRGLDVAEAVGLPEVELAPLRAYVAYRAEDFDETRRQLRLASKSSLLSEEDRNEMLELAEHFSPEDRDALDELLDGPLLVRFFGSLVVRRLDEAGLFNELLERMGLGEARRLWTLAREGEQSATEDSAGLWARAVAWVESWF